MHRHVKGSFQYVVSGVIDKQVQKIIQMHIHTYTQIQVHLI